MKQHNHKKMAGVVLLMGVALSAVTVKFNNERADIKQDIPVLADIPSSIEAAPKESEVLRSYRITGMCCESCTRKLYSRMSALDGVKSCAVDLIEERLSLIVSKEVPAERLLSKLSFDKYSAVELP